MLQKWVDMLKVKWYIFIIPNMQRKKGGDILNANLLRGKMAEKQISQGELAKRIGMSENSLSRKLLGIRDFRLAEVVKIINELQIENPEKIFFTNDVPNMQRKTLKQ